jgi:allantoinase
MLPNICMFGSERLHPVLQAYKYVPRNPFLIPPCGHLSSRNVLLISENIVFPDGVAPGAIHIKRTTFKQLLHQRTDSPFAIMQLAQRVENLGGIVLDVGSAVISPGIVDIHVHLNEPGRMSWEGIKTGTSAAAAGGVTTVVDMPINSRPAVTTAQLMRHKTSLIWVRCPLHEMSLLRIASCDVL